ncbi:MAG: hypothetical protein K6F58_01435 [Bacteroidales bacterium]|nr:hypothetical protein [Bacteroidales bacterium]
MKTRGVLVYILLVAVQILLGIFLNLGPLVAVCILPLLVLCLPVRFNGPVVMLLAFAMALAVDALTHGILGLSVVALLPVAALRRLIISIVFGEEIYSRGEDLSVAKQGFLKMALAILIATALFFAVYIWVDAAGTRSFGTNALAWLLSTLASSAAQLLLMGLLSDREDGRWR